MGKKKMFFFSIARTDFISRVSESLDFSQCWLSCSNVYAKKEHGAQCVLLNSIYFTTHYSWESFSLKVTAVLSMLAAQHVTMCLVFVLLPHA